LAGGPQQEEQPPVAAEVMRDSYWHDQSRLGSGRRYLNAGLYGAIAGGGASSGAAVGAAPTYAVSSTGLLVLGGKLAQKGP
jgi:hypothetical protein